MKGSLGMTSLQRVKQVCLLFAGMLMPLITWAEPAVSHGHVPFLIVFSVGVSALLTWIVVKIILRSGRLQTPMKKWVTAIILMTALLVFLSPVIVALGSIMITGRTM